MTGVASVAVLCDIHGNLPALEAVLDELRANPPGAVVIGGDVAAGPMPHEVIERLLALPWPVCAPAAGGWSTPAASAARTSTNPAPTGSGSARASTSAARPSTPRRRWRPSARSATRTPTAWPSAPTPDEVSAMFETGADGPLAPESLTGR